MHTEKAIGVYSDIIDLKFNTLFDFGIMMSHIY